jgi:hypothetical protein
MTSWEARPALQPEPANATQSKATGFAGALRRQFRELVKQLTGRGPEPTSKPRRRRAGDAGSGFKALAAQILRRVTSLPPFYFMHAPWDTFTWLRIWDTKDPAAGLCENHANAEQQHASGLSPHL